MSHLFRIPIQAPADDVLDQIESTVSDHGLTLTRGVAEDTITGRGFKVALRFRADEVEVEVQEKPFLVPWSQVEAKIRAFFAG